MNTTIAMQEARAKGHNYVIFLYKGASGRPYGGIAFESYSGETRQEIMEIIKKRIAEINDPVVYYDCRMVKHTRIRQIKSKYGEKRQRTGGHGFTDGDGYKEI